jgi:hypothetical protein
MHCFSDRTNRACPDQLGHPTSLRLAGANRDAMKQGARSVLAKIVAGRVRCCAKLCAGSFPMNAGIPSAVENCEHGHLGTLDRSRIVWNSIIGWLIARQNGRGIQARGPE